MWNQSRALRHDVSSCTILYTTFGYFDHFDLKIDRKSCLLSVQSRSERVCDPRLCDRNSVDSAMTAVTDRLGALSFILGVQYEELAGEPSKLEGLEAALAELEPIRCHKIRPEIWPPLAASSRLPRCNDAKPSCGSRLVSFFETRYWLRDNRSKRRRPRMCLRQRCCQAQAEGCRYRSRYRQALPNLPMLSPRPRLPGRPPRLVAGGAPPRLGFQPRG